MKQIDAKDRQIIRELQRDGRLTNQDLAERVNLSPSPCLRRVRLLEEAHVITGYSADVDPRACGLAITAFIRITLARHDRDAVKGFEAKVRDIPDILDCYLLTGEADYLLRVLVADLGAYEEFVRNRLHAIPGVASITTSLVYGTVKQSRLYPLD
jgi:Lrp/AsnC family transcriptional regulator, leucine-responsive regulatory protein